MAVDILAVDWDDPPPFLAAVWSRDFTRAAAMIRKGAALDELLLHDGSSMLHRAAHSGDLDMVDFFLRHGCPRTLESFDSISHTPLIAAAFSGQETVVKALLEGGANPNAHNEPRIGDTAMRYAVMRGHYGIALELLAVGADPTIPGWMGLSAVDQAHGEVAGQGPKSGLARKFQRLLDPYLGKKASG